MKKTYLFEIPIYRLSPSEHSKNFNEFIKKNFEPINIERARYSLPERVPELDPIYPILVKSFGGINWRYNEIIGYLRLYTVPNFDSRILGELWWVTTKRVIKTRRKIFEIRDEKYGFEISSYEYYKKDNNSIFQLLIEKLERIKQEKLIRKYYLDDSLFRSIGRFIDWNSILIESINK